MSSLSLHFCFGNAVQFWHVIAAGQDGYCRVWKVCESSESDADSESPFAITLESVIEVSSTIVSSAHPHPPLRTPSGLIQPFLLLTASMDATLKIIAPEDGLRGGGLFSTLSTLHPHLIGSQGFWGAFWSIGSSPRRIFASLSSPSSPDTSAPAARTSPGTGTSFSLPRATAPCACGDASAAAGAGAR